MHARVLWDVVEEHLEEGSYAALVYERALHSTVRTLADLERHPEELLIAHVDGLRAGGSAVRERLLLPALAEASEEEPERLIVAAWALFEDRAFDALAAVLPPPAPWVSRALAEAARHTRGAMIDDWLRALVALPAPTLEPTTLLWLAHARGLRADELLAPLQSPEPRVVEAAARLARHAEPARLMGIMQYLLDHEDAGVRDAALLAALSWGAQKAWLKCREWALDPAQPSELATVLYAALGTRADQQTLLALLDPAATRHSTLFALGFSGNPALAPALLEALHAEEPLTTKLAAQSLGLIFGFSPSSDAFCLPPEAVPERRQLPPPEQDAQAQADLPPLEADDLDADLVPTPEDELPAPDAAAIAEFCTRRRAGSAQRLLAGAPFGPHTVGQVLGSAPLHVRHALALAHGVRSGGSVWFDTRASTAAQRAALPRVAAAPWQRHVAF